MLEAPQPNQNASAIEGPQIIKFSQAEIAGAD